MATFSAQLALCAGNSSVAGEVPAQRPVTRSFDVFFDHRLNQQLSEQSWGWWFETTSRPLWRHCNEMAVILCIPNYVNVRYKWFYSYRCDNRWYSDKLTLFMLEAHWRLTHYKMHDIQRCKKSYIMYSVWKFYQHRISWGVKRISFRVEVRAVPCH